MISIRGVARVAAGAAMVLLAAGAAQADVFNLGGVRDSATGTWSGLASLETVPVGNPGNNPDTGGYGSVAASYNIGKYDVTAGQYTAFLNAVAATDSYGLYSTSMWSDTSNGCQIQQTISSSGYSYSVSSAYANRPVNYVSFWDACRFANWLSNGQGGAGTTEYGTYSLNGVTNPTNTSITRTTGAKWAVTSEDEWYKAAYYNGTSGTYNLYATGGNSITTAMANYGGSVAHPTDVGSYPFASPYGTLDQSGNVWEWNEAVTSEVYRGLRGGAYGLGNDTLESSYRGISGPGDESSVVGFRVSEVPEPATLSLLALGGLAILGRRRAAKR